MPAMRYRLGTLLIVLGIVPPVIAPSAGLTNDDAT